MLRHRLIQTLCAFTLLLTVPSVVFAEGTTVTSTNVTLQGDTDGTGCAIWLKPAEPIRFGVLAQPVRPKDRLISREFSLRVVNGRDVSPSLCRVTIGGASFAQAGETVRSIHALKLTQSHSSTVPVFLVPQVNEMAIGELQSVLVQSPSFGGCAIVIATLDTTSIPALPADAVILGTLTLTMSDVAP